MVRCMLDEQLRVEAEALADAIQSNIMTLDSVPAWAGRWVERMPSDEIPPQLLDLTTPVDEPSAVKHLRLLAGPGVAEARVRQVFLRFALDALTQRKRLPYDVARSLAWFADFDIEGDPVNEWMRWCDESLEQAEFDGPAAVQAEVEALHAFLRKHAAPPLGF